MTDSAVRELDLLARFGAASQQLGIAVGGVAQALPLVAEKLDQALVGLALDGSALGIATEAAFDQDWLGRASRLAALLGSQPGAVERLLAGRPSRMVRVELVSTPRPAGLAATIRCVGDVAVEDDVNMTVLFGVSTATRDVLAERARFLAADPAARGASTALAIRLALGEPDRVGLAIRISGAETQLPDSMGRVLAIASHLDIGQPQRDLFERIYPVLAAGGEAIAELYVTTAEMRPTISIRWNARAWQDHAWDHAVRIATGLHPADNAARRIGLFSGSFDGAQLDNVVIEFGPDDPPAAWLWATYGRPTQRA